MHCITCGSLQTSESRFCFACGRPNSAKSKPVLTKRRRLPVVFGAGLLLLIILIALAHTSTTSAPSPAMTAAKPQVVPPSLPPPQYHVFKQKIDEGVSYVVPVDTRGEQLVSLLWLFRKNIRSLQFASLGIKGPTSRNFGKDNYNSGILTVYRGSRCANEPFVETGGPCGKGDHSVAVYVWNFNGNSANETGTLRSANGEEKNIFDQNDSWALPPELEAKRKEAELQKRQEEDTAKAIRGLYARMVEEKLRQSGYDISVLESPVDVGEIVIDADMFKDQNTRVMFIRNTLPTMTAPLCKVGFTSIKISRGSMFSDSNEYSLGCKKR